MTRLVLIAALAGLAAVDVDAQRADAPRVVLELRPRAGDTLRMRLDQTTEMTGGRVGAQAKPVVTTMWMYSRVIVESSNTAWASILAMTDSVSVRSSDDRAQQLAADMERQLEGRQMRLRLNPDGTVGVPDAQANLPRAVTDLIAVMPASFPRGSVAVGDTWLREMPIPPSTSMGVPLGGLVKAAFKLDSLSEDGGKAYLSMRGTMHPLSEAVALSDPGAIVGALTGAMVVDRKRGWLKESRFLIDIKATVAHVGGAVRSAPMQFRVKITQHMQVIDRR